MLPVPAVASGLMAVRHGAFRARGLPGAPIVVVGAVPWLILFLVSECSPVLLALLLLGLLRALRCFVCDALVRIG